MADFDLRVEVREIPLSQLSENVGGLAMWRNRDREYEETMALQRKWGSHIIRIDTTNKGHSDKAQIFDYNPIVKIPIRGV